MQAIPRYLEYIGSVIVVISAERMNWTRLEKLGYAAISVTIEHGYNEGLLIMGSFGPEIQGWNIVKRDNPEVYTWSHLVGDV